MDRQTAVNKLLNWARNQIGYTEGSNNYNKFAETTEIANGKLYGWDPQNQPWCDVFVDSGFISCFGYAAACELTYQYSGCTGAACMYSAQYYKDHNAWTDDPEPGDQIFFYASGCIGHTGIVEAVNGSTVTTIEGNTSDMVARRNYSRSSASIAGYGRPKWACLENSGNAAADGSQTQTEYTVQSGDTLWGIALRLLGSGALYKVLMEINGLTSPNIKPGQVIRLTEDAEAGDGTAGTGGTVTANTESSGRTHVVQKGESLWGIALKELGSGFLYKKIKEVNGLTSDTIHPGDVLKIPE